MAWGHRWQQTARTALMNPRVPLTREQIYRLLDGSPVQVQTSVGLLELEGVPNEWVPLSRVEPTSEILRVHSELGVSEERLQVWSNSVYEVIVTVGGHYRKSTGEVMDTDPAFTHLSIKRYDRAPIRNWRHFQQMKNEICGPDAEALEIYPREARLADNANQYHLWVLPAGMDLPVGFESGCVTSDAELARFNQAAHRGRQEPWEPGLTTGAHRNQSWEKA